MAELPADEYRVVIPVPVLQAARQWCLNFLGGRFRDQATRTLEAAQKNLTQTPLAWSDPVLKLASSNIIKCEKFAFPFHFFYRVDVKHRFVYVSKTLLLP